jgi:hypothetical protein
MGYSKPKVIRAEAVGKAPSTTIVTCDTKLCIEYIDNVESMSKALTDRWKVEAQLADAQGDGYPMHPADRVKFLADFKTWVESHRLPWLNAMPRLTEDCGSTFPGPCKSALSVAEKHEDQIIAWDKRYAGYTKKSTGVGPIPDSNDGKGGKDGGSGSLVNIDTSGLKWIGLAAIIAGAIYVSSKA